MYTKSLVVVAVALIVVVRKFRKYHLENRMLARRAREVESRYAMDHGGCAAEFDGLLEG